jgi:hypothetical protein
MSFRQAVARFTAEVDHALTRARRATRDAKAETTDFRRRTEELSRQAKNRKPHGLRRAQATPTSQEAREDAAKFRTDNGLPISGDEFSAREPESEPRVPVVENEDFSQHQVLFDVDKEAPETTPAEPDRIDSPEPPATRSSDAEEDFSQQRILMDATVESYRPDEILGSIFDLEDPEGRR